MSTSTTIYPSADANLRENAADTNYGGNVVMRAGDYTTYRRHAVFMFDVSAITAIADIVSATISFTYSGGSGTPRNMKLARLNQDFVQSEVTWNEASDGVAWTGGAGGEGNGEFTQPVYDISVGFGLSGATADIADLVQDAIARREGELWLILCFDPDDTSTAGARSYIYPVEDATPANRPKLEVVVANRIEWVGNIDGDVENYRNWAGLTAPTSTDIALFTNAASVTTGTLTCWRCIIGRTYRGDYAGRHAPSLLRVEIADSMYLASPYSTVNVEVNDDASNTAELYVADTSSVAGTVSFTGKYNAHLIRTRQDVALATSECSRIDAHGSRVTFTADSTVDVVRITKAGATLEDGSPDLVVVHGTVQVERTDTDTEVTLAGNSVVDYLAHTGNGIYVYGGVVRFNKNTGAPVEGESARVYPKGVLDTRNGSGTVTLSSEYIYLYGGKLVIDAAQDSLLR